MFRLRTASIAALLLAALPAHAQSEPQFRVLKVLTSGVQFVSSDVTGPQTARRLSQVIVSRDNGPAGENMFVVAYTFDCPKGLFQMGDVTAYRGGTQAGTTPGDGRGMVKPTYNSPSAAMLSYACTGKLDSGFSDVLTGLPAVFAFGREKLGLPG